MAAPKKATHVMVHPKQYMAVGGTLQHVPKGTEVAMSVEQGKRMVKRGRALVIGEQKAVDLTADADNKDA
jgi:hypothetical protein